MAEVVNQILNTVGDLLAVAVSWLPPVAAIALLALLVAAASLWIFGKTSDQARIRAAKARVRAHLAGIVLFRRDPVLVMRSLLAALGGSLANLRFLLVPMAVMIVPLLLLFVQLDQRFGYRSFRTGEEAVLRVHMREGASLDDVTAAGLPAGGGLAVVTEGVRVRDPERGLLEVDFRVLARGPCAGLDVRAAGSTFEKRALVDESHAFALFSPERTGRGFFPALLNPAEKALRADSPVESIELRYPRVTYPFLGTSWAWWTLFLAAMVLGLFLLRRPLGVDF